MNTFLIILASLVATTFFLLHFSCNDTTEPSKKDKE